MLSLADRRTKIVQAGATYGRVVGTRKDHTYLIYVNRSTLFAVPFDTDRLEVAGNPVPVLEEVGSSPSGAAEMDVSMGGTLVYRCVNRLRRRSVAMLNGLRPNRNLARTFHDRIRLTA